MRELTPIDPDILRNLEEEARKVAGSLTYIMDNLRNSLYAVSNQQLRFKWCLQHVSLTVSTHAQRGLL